MRELDSSDSKIRHLALWFGTWIMAALPVTHAGVPPAALPELELILRDDGWIEASWDQSFNGWALQTAETPSNAEFSLLERVPLFEDGRFRHRLLPKPHEFFRLMESEPYQFAIPTTPGPHDLAAIDQDHIRVFKLFIPSGYPGSPPPGGSPTGAQTVPRTGRCPGGFPLIILEPGTGQSADSFASAQGDLITNCDAEGFILVITQAASDLNQNGRLVWNNLPDPNRADDVAFIKTLISGLQDTLWIDENRIHLAGFSGGAQNGYLLGATTVDLFASVANIGTSIGSEKLDPGVITYPPEPLAPLPFFIVSSKLDDKRPYDGGPNENGTLIAAAPEAPQFWLGINGHTGPPTTTSGSPATSHQISEAQQCPAVLSTNLDIEVGIAVDDDSVSVESWGEGSKFEVIFTTLELACHQWTNANAPVNFDMNVEALEFFKRHRRQPDADLVAPDPVVPQALWTTTTFAGFDTIHYVPTVPRGLACLFHGTGGDADFASEIEMVELLNQLVADSFAFVSTSSTARGPVPPAEWDIVNSFDAANPGAGNPDVARLLNLRQMLIATTALSDTTPILPLGFSNGARFAAIFAKEASDEGVPIGAAGMLNPNLATNLTPLFEEVLAGLDTPAFLFTTENDTVDPDRTGAVYHDLWERSVDTGALTPRPEFCLGKEKVFTPARFTRLGMTTPEVNALRTFLVSSDLIDNATGERVFCSDEIETVCATLVLPGALAPWQDQVRRQLKVVWSSHYPDAGCKVPLADFFLSTACADASPPAPIPASAAELASDPGPFPVVQRLLWDNPAGFKFDNFDTLYMVPPNPCGLCFIMHGTGGGTGFTGGLDMRDLIHGLVGQGIAVVATESTDRDNTKVPGARWDTEVVRADGSSNLPDNPDWIRLMALRDWLTTNTALAGTETLFFLGFSNGADASISYAAAAQQTGLSVGGIGLLAAGVCQPEVRRATRQLAPLPVFINVLESDHRRWMNEMLRDELTALGHPVQFRLGREKAINPLRFTRIPDHESPPPAGAEYDTAAAQAIFDDLVALGMIDTDGARLLDVSAYESAAAGLSDEDVTRQAKVANAAGHTISSEFRQVLLDVFASGLPPKL